MTIYRLVKKRYAASAFRGSRGRGRWHQQGTPMVYGAGEPATALVETLVHAGRADLLKDPYVLFEVEIDPEAHLLALPEELPEDWQAWPWPESTQKLGSYWYAEGASLALEVPSAVVPRQRNYLLNASHPDFEEAEVRGPEDFPIDPWLAREQGGS